MAELEFPTTSALVTEAVDRLVVLLSSGDSSRKLRVLLTGGTLGIEFCRQAAKRGLDLSRADFMFSDERFVSLDHQDRNEAQALEVWPALTASLIRFPDANQPLESAAHEFEQVLQASLGDLEDSDPMFDLTVLGMGPDGHIASLFPGHDTKGGWVLAEHDSPKPPSQRLSLSYQALNRSARVWFLVSGAAKAEAVKSALSGKELPAGRVTGTLETIWFMDSELRRAL